MYGTNDEYYLGVSGSARPKHDMAGWFYAGFLMKSSLLFQALIQTSMVPTLSLSCGFLDSEATARLRLDTTRPMADTVGKCYISELAWSGRLPAHVVFVSLAHQLFASCSLYVYSHFKSRSTVT